MNETFELTMQNPEEDKINELIANIDSVKTVEELADLVYETGDDELIKEYNQARYDFLLEFMPQTMNEYDKPTSDDALLKDGFLRKAGDKVMPMTGIDAVALDDEFIALVTPLLKEYLKPTPIENPETTD